MPVPVCQLVLGLCGGVCVAGEGLQGWLLGEAARSFPGSKSDPPLAKAEPISDAGSASVIDSIFKKGKKTAEKPAAERGVGCERNNHADTEVSEEGGGGGALEKRFPCSPWRTPRQSRWLGPEKAVTPWESPRWSSSWRTAVRGKDSRWRSSWRADPRGRDPTLEQGKSVRSPPPEEEGAAETMCDELTTTPIPAPLRAGRGGGRGIGSKAEPGKKGGVGAKLCF